jgi:hypothetical protein
MTKTPDSAGSENEMATQAENDRVIEIARVGRMP